MGPNVGIDDIWLYLQLNETNSGGSAGKLCKELLSQIMNDNELGKAGSKESKL